MDCFEYHIRLLVVEWLFDVGQALALIGIGILVGWLWRLTKAKDSE